MGEYRHPGHCYGMPFLLETATIREAAELCHSLGLRFVELNSNFPACLLDQMDAKELRSLSEELGIFFTLHLDDRFDPFDFNKAVSAAYMETMKAAVELAQEAKMPVINMHIPRGNIVTLPDGKHYLYKEYGAAFEASLQSFVKGCTALVGQGPLRLAVENTDGWEDYERAAVETMLTAPAFALTLDIGHDHGTGNRDLPFFEKHLCKLCHMHAHDGRGTANHWALGTGDIPLHTRLHMAAEAKATVVLETKTCAALRQSVDYLRTHHLL